MALRSDHRPSFEIIDAADTLLGVLDDFREQKGKCRGRDLRSTGLVEIAIVDVRQDTVRRRFGTGKR